MSSGQFVVGGNVDGQSVIDRSGVYTNPDDFTNLLPTALKDVNIDFSGRSKLLMMYGFDAINNMILNVALTQKGERDFEPTFGCNLLNLVHEPNDSVATDQIEFEFYDAISYWVPYISLAINGIVCQRVPSKQQVRLYVVYKERTTKLQNTFSFLLSDKGRNF